MRWSHRLLPAALTVACVTAALSVMPPAASTHSASTRPKTSGATEPEPRPNPRYVSNDAALAPIPGDPEPSGPGCAWYGSFSAAYVENRYMDNGDYQRYYRDVAAESVPSQNENDCRAHYVQTAEAMMRMSSTGGCSDFTGRQEGEDRYSVYIGWDGGVGSEVAEMAVPQMTSLTGTLTSCDGFAQESGSAAEWSAKCPLANVSPKQQAIVTTCETRRELDHDDWLQDYYTQHTLRLRRTNCDTSIDTDGDQLADCREFALQTNPNNADTDGDGLADGAEVLTHDSDPLKTDTDGDGLDDEAEVNTHGTIPSNPDTDGDDVLDGPDQCKTTPGTVANNGCPERPFACTDGLDNDGDGTVDTSDPGCTDALDNSELGALQCDDGADNDADGAIDYGTSGTGDDGCTSPTDNREAEDCQPTGKRASRQFRAVSDLPVVFDVHWYTTTVTAHLCERDGGTFIHELTVERHVEAGPVPLLVNQTGWLSGTEKPMTISPPWMREGVVNASGTFQYNACFDVLELFKINKVKKALRRAMERPLAKALEKMMRKNGLVKMDRKVAKEAEKKFSTQFYNYTQPAYLKKWLKDRRVPGPIAGWLADRAAPDVEQIRHKAGKKIVKAAKSGRYDGLAADALAKAMINEMFSVIGRMTAFCGGTDWVAEHGRTWEATVDVSAVRGEVHGSITNHYMHPLMDVRWDGGASAWQQP